MHDPAPPHYLRRADAAAYLGLSPSTLGNWASAGIGPSYSRLGGATVYAVADLDAYVAASRVETTGAAA